MKTATKKTQKSELKSNKAPIKNGGGSGGNGGGGNGGGTDPDLQLERDALNKVALHSFTANPTTVNILSTTTFSWSTTVPSGDIPITIELAGAAVPESGSKVSAPVTITGAYILTANSAHLSRELGDVIIQVSTANCISTTIQPILITAPLKTQFDQRFSGSHKFTLQGSGSTVTLGNGTITIAVPITINVPDWFDADMSIDIVLAVSGTHTLSITAQTVTADISWSFWDNLLSLGCGDLVQSGMTQIAQVFLADIVTSELIPQVTGAINNQINETISAQPSPFALTSVTVTEDGLTYMICPV